MTQLQRRLRVLLIAEACNPEWTSVPLLAYYWYRALRQLANVTLVTQVRNKPAFDRCADTNDVVFIDTELMAGPLHKLGCMLTLGHPTALGVRNALSWPAYLYFEHLVWKRFQGQLVRGHFDLVHRLTPLSPTFASPIAGQSPVPFILGPINGSLPWPPGTESIRKSEGEWFTAVRSVYRALPYWRRTFECAALVLAAGRHVLLDIPATARRRTVLFPENGVDTEHFAPDETGAITKRHPFTILFVGRLVPFKQPSLIIEALAQVRAPRDHIRVLFAGDGPERARIVETAKRLDLTRQVRLLGHVPHENLPDYFRNSSLLALPSIHESGGAVVLEAMACGLPCVVVDYGGPGEYVRSGLGIKIELGHYDRMVAAFAEAFTQLFRDSDFLSSCSQRARRSAETEYSWDAKAARLVRLYHSVLDAGRRNPS